MRFESQLGAEDASRFRRRLSWSVLLILLCGLGIVALTFDRSDWPGLFGDEATYLVAAQSLAWDGDLLFEPHDYERFLSLWEMAPEGLILQSGDGGRTITFGKPFFYPLVLAPFVRLAPIQGPFVANMLILGFAAIVCSRKLTRRLGELAPLWVTTLIFASVVFVYTFQAHADLFLLSCTALAMSLLFESDAARETGSRSDAFVRWVAVGVLMAVVVYSRPLYLALFLPVVLALPRRNKTRAMAGLMVGVVVLVGVAAGVHRINGGAWTSYGGERRGFYASTGYPGIDFPVEQWTIEVGGSRNAAWAEAERVLEPPPTSLSLWGWNTVYFLVGRNIGLLPYFLPIVLCLLGWPKSLLQWGCIVAVAISIAAFFLYRPFNFYGGGGAVANRYFLALYPVLWFVAGRTIRWSALSTVVVLAAPFVWPAWAQPTQFPLRPDHSYAFVSPVASRLLLYETTQSHLKPAGRSDVVHNGVWVKFLTPSLRSSRDGSVLLIDPSARGELLVGSSDPLSTLEVETWGKSAATLDVVDGARVAEQETTEDGQRLRLTLGRPRATHRMWWTANDIYLYELEFRSAAGSARLSFSIRPELAGSST